MGNMQPKNSGLRFFATALAICFLLFLPGCRNALEPQHRPENETPGTSVGTGTFSLTIGKQGLARTIMPSPDCMEGFVKFRLVFAAAQECEFDNTDLPEKWKEDRVVTIELVAGIWDLTVTAFLDSGDGDAPLAAAIGSLHGIEVLPDGKVAGNVLLFPLAEGTGTFSWDIDFDFDDETVVSAKMSITRLDLTPSYIGTYFFFGGTPDIGNPYSLELDAGQYQVVFTLTNDRGDNAVLMEILHVYRDMESHFDGEFTDDHFGLSLLDFVLGAWDGNEWGFYGRRITAGTLAFLGIDGIDAENFAAIVYWFNALTRSSLGSVPYDLAGLLVLTDAALIGIASDDEEFLAYNFLSRADAQAAIFGRVRNGTAITLSWTDDGRAAVRIGYYEIIFDKVIPARRVPGTTLAAQLEWLRDYAQSGNYYIVEISGNENIAPATAANQTLPTGRTNITITLRGIEEMRTVSLSANGSLFQVLYGVTLILDKYVTLQGRAGNGNHLLRVGNGGTLVMKEGSRIVGNTTALVFGTGSTFTIHSDETPVALSPGYPPSSWFDDGGGVRVENNGRFSMYGGEIYGNSGTGVRVEENGTFAMHSGEITGNSGNGVGVDYGGMFTMHGGEITGNKGTGVGVWHGMFTMYDGEISYNTDSVFSSGSGVRVDYRGIFTMRGGKISGNTADGFISGGGVFVGWNSTFTMYGGEIHDNTATGNSSGGGVFVNGTGSEFIMRGGKISGNTSTGPDSSGGVFVGWNSRFSMYGGKIHDHNRGTVGGVRVNNGGTFVMRHGEIYGNRGAQGGGVHVAVNGTFRISDGVIYGSDAPGGLANLGSTGASLSNAGTAQRGTFNNGNFNLLGALATINNTIRVSNGLFVEDFTIRFADFRDIAQNIESIGPSFSILGDAPRITLEDPEQYDSIRWFIGGRQISWNAVQGDYGETLVLDSSVHNNLIGTQRVTVVVSKGGVPFSRTIAFTVLR